MQSGEVYDLYIRYRTGCAKVFDDGYTDFEQFTGGKARAAVGARPTG